MFPQSEDYDYPNSQFFHDTYQWTNAYFGTTEKSFEMERRPPVSGVTDEEFPYEEFLSMFPELGDSDKFPLELLATAYKKSVYFVPNQNCDYLDGRERYYARFLMAAHITILDKQLSTEIGKNPNGLPYQSGQSIGISNGMVASASVGGVSVSMQLPQSATAWEYWLNQTKYGQQYLAYMSAKTPGGIYFGGDDIRGCFRD